MDAGQEDDAENGHEVDAGGAEAGPIGTRTFFGREIPKSQNTAGAARSRAAIEFSCPRRSIVVEPIWSQGPASTYHVRACGKETIYTCVPASWGESDYDYGSYCVRDRVSE